MTEQEELDYCGTLTMAARRLGMVIHQSNPTEDGVMFQFFDVGAHVMIKGPYHKDPTKALLGACQNLSDHLNIKSK